MLHRNYRTLRRDENQALELGRFAIDFLAGPPGDVDDAVYERVEQFHRDSVACAVSALALKTNAPTVLRAESLEYPAASAAAASAHGTAHGTARQTARQTAPPGSATPGSAAPGSAAPGSAATGSATPGSAATGSATPGSAATGSATPGSAATGSAAPGSAARGSATLFGSTVGVAPEKAVVANCSAVREWDSNGTNFGYNPARGATAGEFGHNDFYPVAIAAAQLQRLDGSRTVRAMLLLDEIRGRLAEVFSLKSHKIDHVVHGAIASAATFGAALGATAEQIESAIGLVVAHYIPYRAIRAGKQLSDSKGASAAISAEVAVLSMRRAMRGFVGPADIFRNPEAIFCLFEKPAAKGESPFDLTLACAGDDFAVMGMHFKLGLYEHQSAGAIEGLLNLLDREPRLLDDSDRLKAVKITIYEPAFGIIGDPAKRDPQTRQSADHSMVYIIATLLRKAFHQKASSWRDLMLMPADYDRAALHDPLTRSLMRRIEFRHGGPEYDAKYPNGIPTTLDITHAELGTLSSGLVMFPRGHARNTRGDLGALLEHKFRLLAGLAVDDVEAFGRRFEGLRRKGAEEIATLYDFSIHGVDGQS